MSEAPISAPWFSEADAITIEPADLAAAVADRVIDADLARALVAHAAARHGTASPSLDEEDVRLVTSFNDVFVVLGIALSIGSIVGLGALTAPVVAAPLAALLAWGLSEIFTRRRRMALPSLVLVAVFSTACAATVVFALADAAGRAVPFLAGIAAFAGAYAHWRRFRVPIAMAAMAAGGVGTAIGGLAAVAPHFSAEYWKVILLLAGLGVFLFAMRWDVSDRERRTRRSDTAFWLHVLAAPLLVHPLAGFTGAGFGFATPAAPIPLLGLFLALAVVAIVVDRRALLVSGLAYFGGSILVLIREVGWSGETVGAVTLGLVGASILLLSIAWTPLRDLLLTFVPASVRAFVPAPRAIRGSSS